MRRSRRRRPVQVTSPIVVVDDSDEEIDEDWNPGPHPWDAQTVAAAAAAAAIARADRSAVAQQNTPAQGATHDTPVPAAQCNQPAAAAPEAEHIKVADEPTADEAGSSCNICYEPLYEEGSHRPASLRCGHVFGDSCIRKWLQQKYRCPQCNQKARVNQITLLYNLPKLAAGCAPDDLQRQLQELQESKKREQQRAAELEQSLKELQRQLAMQEHQRLQQQQQRLPPIAPTQQAAGARQQLQQQQQQAAYQPAKNWQQQQQRHPLQPSATGQNGAYSGTTATAGSWPQQQQLTGHKRSWQQATNGSQQWQQQRQQQPTPAGQTVCWPLLALFPVAADRHELSSSSAAAAAAADVSDLRIGGAGIRAADNPPVSTQSQAALTAATCTAAGQQCLPGYFSTLQEFELCGSRSFHLDVPGTLVLVGECPAPGLSRLRKISLVCPGQPSYLPLSSTAGVIRCLASQKDILTLCSGVDSSTINPNYVAVATEKAGLLIASLGSNNVVQTIPVSGPVWSVSWSPHNSHQLLLGLDKGRVAVADIRKSSSQALMLTSNASSSCRPFQPLHSVIPLAPCQVQQLCSSGGGAAVWDNGSAPEAVVACAGGVYSWSRSRPNCFDLLMPSSCHGGNCESIALAADGASLAVSFRSPFGWTPTAVPAAGSGLALSVAGQGSMQREAPMHVLTKLGVWSSMQQLKTASAAGTFDAVYTNVASRIMPTQRLAVDLDAAPTGDLIFPVATQAAVGSGAAMGSSASEVSAAVKAAQDQLMQQTVRLCGHYSSKTLTKGCFISSLPGVQHDQQFFLSADEVFCQPKLWSCRSGAILEQRQPWQSLPSHILQVAWGQSDSLGAALVGAMCDRRLVLFNWQQDESNNW